MEEELGKQLLIRGTKGSRRVTLTEEGMLLRKRAEEILNLVHRTEQEIALSDEALIAGDVFIGSGETQTVRLLARTARCLREKYPGIHLHISSGNSIFVLEQLEKGLIDFGLLYTPVDPAKYESVEIPCRDPWGVLMRKDTPLAEKPFIRPEDLWDKPLIFSVQEDAGSALSRWIV